MGHPDKQTENKVLKENKEEKNLLQSVGEFFKKIFKQVDIDYYEELHKEDSNPEHQVWRTLRFLEGRASEDLYTKNKNILMEVFEDIPVEKYPACRSFFKKILVKSRDHDLEQIPIICDAVTKIITAESVENSFEFHKFISDAYRIEFYLGPLEKDSEEFASNLILDFNKKYEKYKKDRSEIQNR